MELREHQLNAIEQLSNGKILWGGVGSGKTSTSLGYWQKKESDRKVVVITTAKKRDKRDWQTEALSFFLYEPNLIVDSWNNIGKYADYEGYFFIFDEQRVVGRGAWVKNFLKITKKNHWILLSATPGDTWMDYVPVFIANGYYKNISEFKREHVVYEPYVKFPMIKEYRRESHLLKLKSEVLVEMPYFSNKERIINKLPVGHDKSMVDKIVRTRWNPFTDSPIEHVSEFYFAMRRVINSDPSRVEMLRTLIKTHPKMIVFYSFNYERELIREGLGGLVEVAEWSGHRKDEIPSSDRWVYIVQYTSGSEGWNCIETDTIVFYSLPYSYKNYAQAMGRIDRLNSPFSKLYYYIFWADAKLDQKIWASLDMKKNFNEMAYYNIWADDKKVGKSGQSKN